MALVVVRSLREPRASSSGDELADFELDALSEFVLARHSAWLADGTISNDTRHLQLVRYWFERPLWEMELRDADRYFGLCCAGWRDDLASCREFAPEARNYALTRLSADVGLRINEACRLDLDDVRWELGRWASSTSATARTRGAEAHAALRWEGL